MGANVPDHAASLMTDIPGVARKLPLRLAAQELFHALGNSFQPLLREERIPVRQLTFDGVQHDAASMAPRPMLVHEAR